MTPRALPSQECEVVSGQTTEVNIDLPAANAVLEGRITVNGRLPARGDNSAHIQIGSCVFSAEADGSYRLDGLPTGATIVYFSASPFNQMRRLLDLTDQGPNRLDIDFAAGNASLDGTISDAGRPVKRAEVCASVSTADVQCEDFRTTADAGGHYHIDGLPSGSVAVQVTASGHGTRVVNVQTTADQPTRCDIELSGGTVIEGTLTGLWPGESARVVALQGDVKTNDIDPDKVYSLNAKYAEAFLREDGAFSLRGLAPGRYTLIAYAYGHSLHGTNATPRVVSATVDVVGENLTVDLALPK
jgi:hypothetical protein